MRSLAIPGAMEELVWRVQKIRPQSRPQWGSMACDEMFCHLADSFRIVMGQKPERSVR
jgi:hypothetical protein